MHTKNAFRIGLVAWTKISLLYLATGLLEVHPSYGNTITATVFDADPEKGNASQKILVLDQPFSCWSCNSTQVADGCFNLTEDTQTDVPIQQCQSETEFCQVERVWYVYGKNKSIQHDFSVYRNCSKECQEYCNIMGDRTKIITCSTCCTTPLCNTGISGGSSFGYLKDFWIIFILAFLSSSF